MGVLFPDELGHKKVGILVKVRRTIQESRQGCQDSWLTYCLDPCSRAQDRHSAVVCVLLEDEVKDCEILISF